jgi:hypothetical protein
MTTAKSTTDDNLLLAIRYVLNECDPNELAEFEARLGDDQTAQAALVEAVQIVALLQATPNCAELAPRPIRAVPARRSWQVASLVAASLLIAVVAIWQSRPSLPLDHSVAMTNESPALAQAWTALDPQIIASEDIDEAPTSHGSPDEIVSDVPDWLLAAVMAEFEQRQPDDHDMEIEAESQL